MIQLVIVHPDAELGRQLRQMVKDYTGYQTVLTSTEGETLFAVRRQASLRPRLLLTSLQGPSLDGFALGAMLSEMYPGLQTLFFPAYAAQAQRMEIAGSKVFPEPIDGERLVSTIERAARMLPGAPDFFHAIDILQLCCLERRGGAVQMVAGPQIGTAYLRDGRIVHAETGTVEGADAMFELASWSEVEFAYDPALRAPSETLRGNWEEVLVAAVTERQRRALPDWRR